MTPQSQDDTPETLAAPPNGKAPEDPSPQEGQDAIDAPSLVEHPVYFVSMVHDARSHYRMPHRLLLALLIASRKLCHYFQGDPIKVVPAYPLEKVLRSPNVARRVAEWNIELQEFQLEFSTTRVIKGTTLAVFVAEWTDAPNRGVSEDCSLTPEEEAPDGCVMYFDGAFARQGAGARVVLISPTQDKLYYAVQLCFSMARRSPITSLSTRA